MTYPKRDLLFDHDPRSSSADCPADACAAKSKRLAWTYDLGGGNTSLTVDLTDVHFTTANRAAMAELTIFSPSTELLEALMTACTDELERRHGVGA